MGRLIYPGLIILLSITIGCSKASSFISPETGNDSGLPVFSSSSKNTSHNLLGMWTIYLDIENESYNITCDRSLKQHFNVTSLIPPPGISINSYNPGTQMLDIDVTIENPYQLNVYDMRLIIYTDTIDHKLENDDSWTALYDIPGGLPINPFIAYAKEEAFRKFPELSEAQIQPT